MAKQLSKTDILDGQLATAAQVTQSIDALTGDDGYDITISGSLVVTGSTDLNGNLAITGFPNVSASLASSGLGNGFPFTGSAGITGSLELTGSYNVLASEGSNLSLEVNESASFQFLTGGPNTGSFIIQTSPDIGKGELQVFTGQGNATIASQNIPNQIFGVKYTTGSNASEGELTMTVGKRDLTNIGSSNLNNFYVAYEPSGILTNAQGELEFHLGDHFKVGNGIVLEYRGGASGTTQTSSFAGYFSSSAFPNQQQYTRPFAISTLTQVNDSNPAFVINKNIDFPTASNFSVDYGGNVNASGNISASGDISGDKLISNNIQVVRHTSNTTFLGKAGTLTNIAGPITASSNISASGDIVGATFGNSSGNIIFTGNVSGSGTNSSYFGDEYNAHGGDANSGFTLLSLGSKPSIHASGASLKIGNTTNSTQTGIDLIGEVTASGNISASGHLVVNEIQTPTFKLITPVDKAASGAPLIKTTGDIDNTNAIISLGDPDGGDTGAHIRIQPDGEKVTFQGLNTTITGSITTTAFGLFQGGKPIITHTTHLSASTSQAGFYNIVGGQFTCSITISSAPVGAEYEFFQTSSAGNFFFHTGSGITLISKNNSLRLAEQGSSAVLKKVATDTFHLMGDLT
tara:strand:- start:43858 stop:45753 length:1896 start_codon:yes stop_codon:yes gene_type:complete